MLPSVWPVSPASLTPHLPVLAREVVAWLDVEPGMTVVDCTFGAGGHAALLADAMGGRGAYIGLDRDPTVREHFGAFRDAHPDMSARFVRGNFALGLRNLAATGVRADAILLDLGVSSMQIDRPERGFSYATDAPLDMRMDPSESRTAADLVNELSERELSDLFHRLGEERYARPIARAIVRRRARRPLETTDELVEAVTDAVPTPARFAGGHPAKRVFQAIRIAVNDELTALDRALPAAWELLRPGGRLAVISFHSLEDRRVKRFLAERARGCVCPPELPTCVCGREPEARLLTRGGITPSAEEARDNPRARSGRLRAALKLRSEERD